MMFRKITADELPDDLLQRNRVEVSFMEAFLVVKNTQAMWMIEGKQTYGVLGMVKPTLISSQAALWLLWFKNVKPPLSDWRKSAVDFRELQKELQLTFWVDVVEDDTIALRFAEHFGFKETENQDGFRIMKGEI